MIGILIIALLWVLFVTKSNAIRASVIVFFLVWQGIPAFYIWQADKLVNELCSKDGAVNINEVIILPKERFNEYGQFLIHDKRYIKSSDEYFTDWQTTIIKGSPKDNSLLPKIIRHDYSIVRVNDGKVLGDFVSYSQIGGESIGFSLVQAGHTCPKISGLDLQAKVFIKVH